MSPIGPLGPQHLVRRCEPTSLPPPGDGEPADPPELLGQQRALEALRLGLLLPNQGYNVFAAGPNGVGKRALVERLLTERNAERSPPDDWCYVHNFSDPHQPRAIRLPAGRAARVAAEVAGFAAAVPGAVRGAFESAKHRAQRQQLEAELQRREQEALQAVELESIQEGVQVSRVDDEFVVTALEGNEPIAPRSFNKLPTDRRGQLEAALSRATERVQQLLHDFNDWEQEAREARRELARQAVAREARRLLAPLRQACADLEGILEHLDAVEQDLIRRAPELAEESRRDSSQAQLLQEIASRGDAKESFSRRYSVNAIVDHSRLTRAPIVYEDNPTHANLVGRIEPRSRFGSRIIDFNHIVAGALHRARGGCLLVDALELLARPHAWRTLQRVLRSGEIRIEPPDEPEANSAAQSLSPDAIPLGETKIVLLGDESTYYQLCAADPTFLELFKVLADFDEEVDWTEENEQRYARVMATLAQREGLRSFDSSALARLIEHASRSTDDAQKLSVAMRPMVDLLIESDAVAQTAAADAVSGEHVERAIQAQLRRHGRQRQEMLEAVRRRTLFIDCEGQRVGQVNGLAVSLLGPGGFGHVVRITARVHAGRGDLVDIDREVALGGPIHAKGVLLLAGFLGSRYAGVNPLCLSASIAFEQSYTPIEGDSASLAEACALLSALAGAPVDQSFAVTGSVNQQGEVQPVGAVNDKVEGFFDTCRVRGCRGTPSVILPESNTQNLMLRRDVVEAAEAGRFRVYPVSTVDEALELLLGRPAGDQGEDGSFPSGSLNQAVRERLEEFARAAQRFGPTSA